MAMAAQAAQQKIRIKLKSYHVDLINQACDEIKGVVSETGAALSGPVPLPMNKKVRLLATPSLSSLHPSTLLHID